MNAHYLGQVVFHVKNLERARDFCRDILMRQVMPTSPPTVEYALTDLGRELTLARTATVCIGS